MNRGYGRVREVSGTRLSRRIVSMVVEPGTTPGGVLTPGVDPGDMPFGFIDPAAESLGIPVVSLPYSEPLLHAPSAATADSMTIQRECIVPSHRQMKRPCWASKERAR
jgi:hypothetical protein